MATRNALTSGTVLRQYEIKKVLGQGGFGITYLARDLDLDRDVAIKECYPRDFVEREGTSVVATSSKEKTDFTWALDKFVDEATTLAKFKHPGIVQILQILKEENGTAYIVLEYVEGVSLGDWLKKRQTPPAESELREIIKPIFEALQAVHEKNYAHRDIAPDNIFIRPNGSAVLLDFGAAKQIMGHYSRTMNLIVKDGYSAPEQYYTEGKQGPWTDVYALSATMYRIISGNRPADAMARQDAITNDEPDPLQNLNQIVNEGYSKEFLDSVMSGMTVAAKNRPQSLQALREKMLGSDSESASGRSENANEEKQSQKSANWKLVAAMALLLLAGVGGFAYYQDQEQKRQLAEQARIEVELARQKAERKKAELAAWNEVSDDDTKNGYQTFIQDWPDSEYVTNAKEGLENLSKAWTRILDQDGSQKVTAIAANENLSVVAGWTATKTDQNIQATVQAFSLSGKPKWQAEFGAKGNEVFEDILLRKDNSVLAIGHAQLSPSKPQTGIAIGFSPRGKMEWQTEFKADNGVRPTSVALLPNGNAIVAGSKRSEENISIGWMIELNPKGDVVSEVQVKDKSDLEIRDIAIMPNGNLGVVGNITPEGRDDKNFWFARMSTSGEIVMQRNAGGPKPDSYNAISLRDSGDLIAVGQSQSFSKDNTDAIVVRIAANNRMTPRPMVLEKDDQLHDVTEMENGDIVLVGTTNSLGAGNTDGWLMKYDKDVQKLVWQRVIGGEGWDAITGVVALKDGSILAAGNTDSLSGNTSDIMVIRIDKDGNYEALPNQ